MRLQRGMTKRPLNFYGESKLMSEQFCCRQRIGVYHYPAGFIYGKTWPNLRPIFALGKAKSWNRQSHKVVSDQLRTPTYVEDIL